MSDSVAVKISSENIERENRANLKYALDMKFESGIGTTKSTSGLFGYKSPLTGAECKIKADLDNAEDQSVSDIAGYFISLNVPACTIGNNVLVENRVPDCGRISLYLLKTFLLEKGISYELADSFTVSDLTYSSVTLTYLIGCATEKKAVVLKHALYRHAAAIHNNKKPNRLHQPVRSVGSERDSTIYCDHDLFEITAYIKRGKTKKAFAKFKNVETERALYAEGAKILRIEIRLKANWLIANGLTSISSWKPSLNGANPYKRAFQQIRDYLRLDESFRQKAPQPAHLSYLDMTERELLSWHLDGNDARSHRLIREGRGNLGRQKRFSAIKQSIWRKVRIDLSIPWKSQVDDLSSSLAAELSWENQYKIPEELKPYSFCKEAIPQIRDELNAKLSELRENQHVAMNQLVK